MQSSHPKGTHLIRLAIDQVMALRQASLAAPALQVALQQIKQLQAQRFARVYRDLLESPLFGSAAHFFLTELYADKDFQTRDRQFARIADTVEKLFPQSVVDVTLALAELHLLSEQLDFAMARAALTLPGDSPPLPAALAYLHTWRATGAREQRLLQLASVMTLGRQLGQLARTPGLRLMLKMMRGPAAAAGLSDLQRFLEAGFDAFAKIAKHPSGVSDFLGTIQTRESAFIDALFDAPEVTCVTLLS